MTDTLRGAKAAAPKRNKAHSPWLKLGVEMGPLILFFFANSHPKLFEPLVGKVLPPQLLEGANAGLYTATVVLMASVVVALVVSFTATRKLPIAPLVTAALAVIFGALTLYLQDTTFIKMKPTVLYGVFAIALLGGLALNKLLLPIIFNQALVLTERGWRVLTLRWGAFFIAIAILNEIVWRTQSNDVWVAFKFPGIMILLLVFIVAQTSFIMRHQLEAERERLAAEGGGFVSAGGGLEGAGAKRERSGRERRSEQRKIKG